MIMRKLLFLLPLIIPSSAHAITWNQFWRPFEGPRYVVPYVPVPICSRPIIREEYVPGDYWRSGYMRRWTEWITVPCNYTDVY